MSRAPSEAPPRRPGCGLPLFVGCGTLLLALAICGGFVGLAHHQATRAEPVVDAFSAALAAHDYEGAYGHAGAAFQASLSGGELAAQALALEEALGAIQARRLIGVGIHADGSGERIELSYRASYERGEADLLVVVHEEQGELRVERWEVRPASGPAFSFGPLDPTPGARAAAAPPSSARPARPAGD